MSDPVDHENEALRAIRERLANASKGTERVLTRAEQRRLKALQDYLQRLKAGKTVQNRALKNRLTDEQFSMLQELYEEQKELRADIRSKPIELDSYNELVKQATFLHNRAESYSVRGNHEQARRFFAQFEVAAEKVFERYEELIAADISMQDWFDRTVESFEKQGQVLNLEHIPRVVTSRSQNAGSGGILSRKMSNREVKIYVIEMAINELMYDA